MSHGRKLAVIGLGYVGLPVAVAFARHGTAVIGFDIDATRIAELKAGRDRTREVDRRRPALTRRCTSPTIRPSCPAADFFIVTVPTPIDKARRPDLTALLAASRTVGKALKRGDIVVYESTVYPGATEEDCVPVLEQASGLVGRARLHRRLFAGAHQSGRQGASLRDHQEGGLRAGRAHARHRRRGLRLGRHRRHPPGAVDQGGGSRQGDRELAARSQHRVHERTVGHLPPARHRHRRRAGGGGDQVELPPLHARPGRRPLHRRRSVLPHLPGAEGRLSSRRHPRRPADQRRGRRAGRARMHAAAASAPDRAPAASPCSG